MKSLKIKVNLRERAKITPENLRKGSIVVAYNNIWEDVIKGIKYKIEQVTLEDIHPIRITNSNGESHYFTFKGSSDINHWFYIVEN